MSSTSDNLVDPRNKCFVERNDSGLYGSVIEQIKEMPNALSNLEYIGTKTRKPDFHRGVDWVKNIAFMEGPGKDAAEFRGFIIGEIAEPIHGTLVSARGNHYDGRDDEPFKYIDDKTKVKDVLVLRAPTLCPLDYDDQRALLQDVENTEIFQDAAAGWNPSFRSCLRSSTAEHPRNDLITITTQKKYGVPAAAGGPQIAVPAATPKRVARVKHDEVKLGAFYDPRLLEDFGGPVFRFTKAILRQLDIRDGENRLIPAWKHPPKQKWNALRSCVHDPLRAARLNWDLPWKSQSTTKLGYAYNAIEDDFCELCRFVGQWDVHRIAKDVWDNRKTYLDSRIAIQLRPRVCPLPVIHLLATPRPPVHHNHARVRAGDTSTRRRHRITLGMTCCSSLKASPPDDPEEEDDPSVLPGGEGRVGAVAVTVKGGVAGEHRTKHLGPLTEHTVFESEVTGAILALDIISSTPRLPDVDVFIDCQPAITALSSAPKAQPGQYLIAAFHASHRHLLRSRSTLRIRLHWVPAHVGIEGNEAVDERAKEAALGSSTPLAKRVKALDTLPISKAAAIAADTSSFKERWVSEWNTWEMFLPVRQQ
ncbi:hypothetical protein B0H14DRAFT_3567290 [Mycena olivaceomarginata]|nr:hypothetical protein B0H14DRAFT_3567290 [Mycena olivaceomarginata]